MALDGAMISLLRRELCQKAVGARVDKIHMPTREEAVIAMHGQGGGFKLLLCAKGAGARAGITLQSIENPKQPPMFCMLLRKHIGSSRLVDIRQPGLERILFFDFSGYNEMGDPAQITLALEMMGRHSNLVLIGSDGRILDATRRIDASQSAVRVVLPGLEYELPPKRGRFDITATEPGVIVGELLAYEGGKRLADCIMDMLQGVSPLLSRELSFAATGDTDALVSSILPDGGEAMSYTLAALRRVLTVGNGEPIILSEPGGKPKDMAFIPIGQYGKSMDIIRFDSYSELLDSFYSARDAADRLKQRSGDMTKLMTTRRDRVARRIAAQSLELEESLKRDNLRQMGDILSANLYNMRQGMASVTLDNFYDPGESPITIPLDPKLTPTQNAQRYYLAYRKADTSHKKLTELLRQGRVELEYLETILDSLSRATSEEEYAAIREELAGAGIVRRRTVAKKNQKPKLRPNAYRSGDGFLILSGRNNLENEFITFKEAGKQDIWLHAQKVPGSHTVILAQGRDVPNSTLEQAAIIAAVNSKLRQSSKVAVDYTQIKNVKKIHGAGPGMVIYDPYETAIVDPNPELAQRLAITV